eukprot:SAG11_NODE_59_length_19156_cov_11.188750_1_plen_39_part_00
MMAAGAPQRSMGGSGLERRWLLAVAAPKMPLKAEELFS